MRNSLSDLIDGVASLTAPLGQPAAVRSPQTPSLRSVEGGQIANLSPSRARRRRASVGGRSPAEPGEGGLPERKKRNRPAEGRANRVMLGSCLNFPKLKPPVGPSRRFSKVAVLSLSMCVGTGWPGVTIGPSMSSSV